MLTKATSLLLAVLPLSSLPLTLQNCQDPPEYESALFALTIEACTVTTNGAPSIQDISLVSLGVHNSAEKVTFYLPDSCMDDVTFQARLEGTHVVVEAGLGCSVQSGPGPNPPPAGEWASVDAIEFDGYDQEDGDQVIDYIEGVITVGWQEVTQGPDGSWTVAEVDCSGRPFSAHGDFGWIAPPSPAPDDTIPF